MPDYFIWVVPLYQRTPEVAEKRTPGYQEQWSVSQYYEAARDSCEAVEKAIRSAQADGYIVGRTGAAVRTV